jgi:hypothetical protein
MYLFLLIILTLHANSLIDRPPNAEAQPPPEQAKPAEGTKSTPVLLAVGCSASLCIT